MHACIFVVAVAAAFVVPARTRLPDDPEDILGKHLKVAWRDDAIGHPDLIAFRNKLIQAAKRHDMHTILATADPDFRGCDMRHIDDLRQFFTAAKQASGPWQSFYGSLTEGGILSPDGRTFSSNYAVSLFPSESTGYVGPEYFRVVRGTNVPVHQRPDFASKVIARLSSSIIIPENPIVDKGWQGIEFEKGRFGFISSTKLIDPIGMSVQMKKRHGRWRLTAISTYCD